MSARFLFSSAVLSCEMIGIVMCSSILKLKDLPCNPDWGLESQVFGVSTHDRESSVDETPSV